MGLTSRCLFFQKPVQAYKVEDAEGQLACQQSPEVAADAEARNGEEDKGEAHQQADDIHEKDLSCFAESLQNTGQSGVEVQKRTDEAESRDEISGERTFEECAARPVSEEQKTDHAAEAHQSAVFYGFDCGLRDDLPVSERVIFGDYGE